MYMNVLAETRSSSWCEDGSADRTTAHFVFSPFVMPVYCFPALNGAYERKQSRVTDQQTFPPLSLVTWQIKGNK